MSKRERHEVWVPPPVEPAPGVSKGRLLAAALARIARLEEALSDARAYCLNDRMLMIEIDRALASDGEPQPKPQPPVDDDGDPIDIGGPPIVPPARR